MPVTTFSSRAIGATVVNEYVMSFAAARLDIDEAPVLVPAPEHALTATATAATAITATFRRFVARSE
jgi:hypothetical protein